MASPAGAGAPAALRERLVPLIQHLEPLCLGLYWPLPGEFDAPSLLPALEGVQWALPFARRDGSMAYRRWNGAAPAVQDEMGIASSNGAPADPDLVLVPCLGHTPEGYRLGYGGGYFDRWLAANPGVTAVGLSWSVGACTFDRAPHDLPLSIVVTEAAVIAP